MEHGICAALQYIVSFVLHASKYLGVELLYKMGLYRKNKRGQFIMHTYIERKGKYYRLYWICHKDKDKLNEQDEEQDNNTNNRADDEQQEEEEKKEEVLSIANVSNQYHHKHGKNKKKYKSKQQHHQDGGNILEFEHALHLLEENINDLCIKCGVKSSNLHYHQFIGNLIELIKHLEQQYKQKDDKTDDNNTKNIKSSSKRTSKNEDISKSTRNKARKIKSRHVEQLNIIPDYGLSSDNPHLYREHSTSNSSSHSFSESTTAINNSESDIVLSPPPDSEHEDWDFVEYN